MAYSDSEDYCITQIINFNHRDYYIGFVQLQGLEVSEEWIMNYSATENGGMQRYDYNMKTKELIMNKKDKDQSTYTSNPITSIQYNTILDISNDGMRWEGSCLNHSPFGYICLINESNELVYRGVMIGDKKECFGIDYYPDLGQIEYIGCYYNNERHGFGMLYDRKGELLYEGDWLCGSNEYETNVVLKDINNDRMVHSLIHELVIDEGVGNDYKGDLLLCEFNYLERLVVKKNSFQNANCLKISDNCVLKSIEIEDGEWCSNDGAFYNVKSVVITSTSNDI